jgi:hypothetical protein
LTEKGGWVQEEQARPNPYLDLCEKTIGELIREDSVKDGWVFSHEEKDVAVWTKKTGATGVCVKGVGVINSSPMDVLSIICDVTKRKWYDDMISEGRVLEEVDDCTQVVYQLYKAGALCKTGARDFVHVSYWRRLPNGTCVLVGKSIEHPSMPSASPPAGTTRAEVVCAGWVIKPSIKDPNRALATYVLHLDLKGSVPAAMVNVIVRKQPQCINELRSRAQ